MEEKKQNQQRQQQALATTTSVTNITGGAIYLSNVDDYVGPSQACVNPLFGGSSTTTASTAVVPTTESTQAPPPPPVAKGVVQTHRRNTKVTTTTHNNDDDNKTNEKRGTGGGILLTAEEAELRVAALTASTSSAAGAATTAALSSSNQEKVTASIADCLACSGCVTTAETVLLEEHHSIAAFQDLFRTNYNSQPNQQPTSTKFICCTISPAAWADLARHLKISTLEEENNNNNDNSSTTTVNKNSNSSLPQTSAWQAKFAALLYKTLGISVVLDGNVPLQWSLEAAAHEFCQAYQQNQVQQQVQQQYTPTNSTGSSIMSQAETLERQLRPSMALSRDESQYLVQDANNNNNNNHNSIVVPTMSNMRCQQALPVLSSSCPALVCLVEKSTHAAVPHLATTKSSMALAGNYLCNFLQFSVSTSSLSSSSLSETHENGEPSSTSSSSTSSSMFHLAIMPCHDKKLEASRKDFVTIRKDGNNGVEKDVDMVITTLECFQLIREAFILEETEKNNNNNNNKSTAPPVVNNDKSESIQVDASAAIDADWIRKAMESLAPATIQTVESPVPTQITVIPTLLTCPSIIHDVSSSSSSAAQLSRSKTSFFVYGSGGYADYIFRTACHSLFGIAKDKIPMDAELWKPVVVSNTVDTTSVQEQGQENRTTTTTTLQVRQSVRVAAASQRKRDFYQAVLYRNEMGEYSFDDHDESHANGNSKHKTIVLKFAIAYGMQTLQRVLKPFASSSTSSTVPSDGPPTSTTRNNSSNFHYVEAMACPSGCLNGNGQIRVAEKETPSQTRLRIAQTQQGFLTLPPSTSSSTTTTTTTRLVSTNHDSTHGKDAAAAAVPEESNGSSTNCNSNKLDLYTKYHVVPPLQLALGATAGVAVKDVQW